MTLPGKPVRGSRSGRPIMALLDLLGRRWALRILWELREGPVGFRDLQARCDAMSPSVLQQRLEELDQHRLATRSDSGAWALTSQGAELVRLAAPLTRWAESWAASLRRGAGS
jgi:DNA-binding HxlR family transcriptional regulator